MPIGVGDCVHAEQAVLAALFLELRVARVEHVAVDAAVDDDMGDVNPLRPPVARHGLRQRAQRGLGRGERSERRAAFDRGGRAGEDERAASARDHAPAGLAPDQKAAQTPHPPDHLEELGFGFQQRLREIVAGVVHDQIERAAALALRGIEQAHHIRLARSVGHHRGRHAAPRTNTGNHGVELGLRAPGYEYVQSLARQAVTHGAAHSDLGADAHHDRFRFFRHSNVSSRPVQGSRSNLYGCRRSSPPERTGRMRLTTKLRAVS